MEVFINMEFSTGIPKLIYFPSFWNQMPLFLLHYHVSYFLRSYFGHKDFAEEFKYMISPLISQKPL